MNNKNIDLSRYGITNVKEIIYNPSFDKLYEEETHPELNGYEKAFKTELGALNVMTGVYTGRSPKDKYIVKDDVTEETVWWNTPEYPNDNKPITPETWEELTYSFESPVCYGSSLASPLCHQHVHSSHT